MSSPCTTDPDPGSTEETHPEPILNGTVESSVQTSPQLQSADPPKETSSQKPLDEILQEFVDYEQGLTISDYVKRFYLIRLEQEALRGETEYASNSAALPIHYQRNRYRDILPCGSFPCLLTLPSDDHNRVVLAENSDNPGGYMNASVVSLPGGKTKFIAAQAPLPATLDEWWQMISEQKVNLIVMLCKLVEMNKVKCEQYWPENKGEKLLFGNYEVTFENEEKFDDDEYLLRTLILEDTETGEKRTLKQLHYVEWPDHGCPSGETQLLNMIEKMADLHTDREVPVLVHCSAGVGRTGTIIAINHIRELLESGLLTDLDLFELVMSLRKQRASMVQTQDQYQFVHKCVATYARRKLGLPDPDPAAPREKPRLPPKPVMMDSSSDDSDNEGTAVPDFPHEPPAPRGPEELGSAAS